MHDDAALLSAQVQDELDTIKGWFFPSDRRIFSWLLARQTELGVHGNLVELGSYLGKSAVLIGDYVQPGETFTVLDLFEGQTDDADNAAEQAGSYATLTEQRFVENYLRFHPQLPTVVRDVSSVIVDRVPAGSCRFVHVDASHLYDHVSVDVDSARTLLAEQGIVAFDDYRSEHCPGVAAAVWEGVLDKGLQVIGVSENKLYATWGDPEPWRTALLEWLTDDPNAWGQRLAVYHQSIVRAKAWFPKPPPAPAVAAEQATTPAPAALAPAYGALAEPAAAKPADDVRRESRARHLAKDLLPPVVSRHVARRLRARRR